MDDTDTEPAETEPLVKHDAGSRTATTTTTASSSSSSATCLGGGTTPGGGGSATRHGAASRGTTAPPPRTPSRHHLDAKPRLSLVPETNERSTEDDQEEGHEGGCHHLQQQQQQQKCHMESPTPMCPFFGVKNYLHQFYEKSEVNDPALYEDLQTEEQVYLVKQTDGGCSSSVFRLSLILGGLLLLLGIVAFIVAACAARRTILVTQNGGVSVVDRVASVHNAQVDALLLVGLVAVTLGSSVVAAALISRTFCSRPEEYPDPFRVDQYVVEPPLSPIESKVPATEKLTQVQPTWGVKGLHPFP